MSIGVVLMSRDGAIGTMRDRYDALKPPLWKKPELWIDCFSAFWLRSHGKWQAYLYIFSWDFTEARTSLHHLDWQTKAWKSGVLMAQSSVLRQVQRHTHTHSGTIPQDGPAFSLKRTSMLGRACMSATWMDVWPVWVLTGRVEAVPWPRFASSGVQWLCSPPLLHWSNRASPFISSPASNGTDTDGQTLVETHI